MKPLKLLLAAAAAAVCMLSSGFTCFAEPEENYVVTTTTGTSAEGQDGVVWTQITENKPINGLDNDAANFSVSVSNIENKRFTATVDINCKYKITAFSGSVGYNKDHYRLVSAKLTEQADGVMTEENTEGKFGFQFSSEQGSDHKGSYIELTFEGISDSMEDDVLFLTVDSVTGENAASINFNKTDGVVKPSASPQISNDVKTIRLAVHARPYTFAELGFTDVINCEIEESKIAKHAENGIVAMTPGSVEGKLINKDYSIQKVKIEVYRVDEQGNEQSAPIGEEEEKTEKGEPQPAKTSVNIGVPLLLAFALFVAYLLAKSRAKCEILPWRIKKAPARNARPQGRMPGNTERNGRYEPYDYSRHTQREPMPAYRRYRQPQARPPYPPRRDPQADRNVYHYNDTPYDE